MADETEFSTPTNDFAEGTSDNEPTNNNVDTSKSEPTTETTVAENETEGAGTQEGEKLYAGKYKNVEELEKGYSEAQKYVTKASELEKKYNELLQQKEEEARRAYEARQEEAQRRGFMTASDAEIADKVQLAEIEYYAQNLNQLSPDVGEQARQLLSAYVQTGYTQYLDEAKRFFNPAFIENVAQAKNNLRYQLQAEQNRLNQQQKFADEEKLANTLKAEFKDFLADVNDNEGKASALQSFCGGGFINSVEDMHAFQNVYSKIAEYERAQAIKEYEAQKAIKATKEKSSIDSTPPQLGNDKAHYTVADVANMTQKQFDDYCAKHGTDWLYK